jgi:hypothetical protein
MSDNNSQAQQLLPFYIFPNVLEKRAVSGEPWNFNPGPEVLAKVRAMPKGVRRDWSASPSTIWSIYSSVKALAPSIRISKENPPVSIHGFVADYDYISDLEEVTRHLSQVAEELRPTFIERSIGKKWRVIWCFEKPILTTSFEHCEVLLKAYAQKFQAPTLLAGYDEASTKPTQVWTNGCEWYDISKPINFTLLQGVAIEASKRSLFGSIEIPLDKIAAAVKERFPDRWVGEFKLGATGVRFWDPTADCPTGCQVKESGMLCFTGNAPFVRWSEIFGTEWCAKQRALNLGQAAERFYFDGRTYWEPLEGRWVTQNRGDVILGLKDGGLSDKTPKGMTVSDVERVLRHVQTQNRIDGAAPLVNYPSGLVDFCGRKLLNTARLSFPEYPADAKGDPSEFPFIWETLNNLFIDRGDQTHRSIEYFLAWLQRSIWALRYHKPGLLGQVPFICGPANNGKSLLAYQLVAPLLGGVHADPIEYFKGNTDFTDDLLAAALLMMNDVTPPANDRERSSFLHRLKSFVVNPTHTYHPKFMQKLDIPWNGRLFPSLNDDPLSVSLLPEVNENTRDKMMFFATQPPSAPWPLDVQARFERERWYFCYWLDKVWKAPAGIISNDRMGVVSHFDSVLLETSQTQMYSYNLVELLKQWVLTCWLPEEKEKAVSPTELLSQLSIHEHLQYLIREWNVQKISKSLATVARMNNHGIEFAGGGSQRTFKITKEKLLAH